MSNKYPPGGAKDDTQPAGEQPRRPAMTTLGDFWPTPPEGGEGGPPRRLEPASKAVTALGGDKGAKTGGPRAGVKVTLAPLERPSVESEWYETYCATCVAVMHIHRDWEKPPRHCKNCREKQQANWITRPCKKCSADMRVCKEWSNPPDRCEACRRSYRPKMVSCHSCHEKFEISVGLQIKAEEMGWKLPTRCKTCREAPSPERKSKSSADRSLSHNISNRYKTSRVMGVRVRIVGGGAPSSGRRR